MDGVVFLIRLYWPQVVGFALTYLGVGLLQSPSSLSDHTIRSLGLMLCMVGWMGSVFHFFTWPGPTPTGTKPRVRVFWPGLCAFIIAVALSVAFHVFARGWTQDTIEVCIGIALLVLGTAAKAVWDRRNDNKV